MNVNTAGTALLNEVTVMLEDDDERASLLREIMFEADLTDKVKMRDLVYRFGSLLKAKDRLGRRIFVILASLF